MRQLGHYISMALLLFSVQLEALPTKNSTIPLAEVIETGRYRFELENVRAVERDDDIEGTGIDHTSSVGLLWGAPQFGIVGIEAGVDWVEPTSEALPESLMLNFRVSTTTLEDKNFAGALGMHSVGFASESNDYNVMYGVVENKFWDRYYAAFGGYAGSNKLLVDENDLANNKGFFIGFWYNVQPNGRGRLGFEWTSGRNELSKLNLGLSVEFDHGIYGNFTISLPNNTETYRSSAMFRLSVDL